MSFTVYIFLSSVGSEAGPFNLYSDVDNYVVPFATNVPTSALTSYYAATVPDGTQYIRIKSMGDCMNYIDISIDNIPTPSVTPSMTATVGLTPTTTSTPTVTPTTPACKSYTATKLSTFLTQDTVYWTDCYGVPQSQVLQEPPISEPDSITFCAREGTVVYNAPQISVVDNGTCVVITPTPSLTPTNTITPSPTSTPLVSPTTTSTPTITPTTTQTPSGTPSPCTNSIYTSGQVRATCSDYCTTNYNITTTNFASEPYASISIGDFICGYAGQSGYLAYSNVSTDTTTGPFLIADIDGTGEVLGIYVCDGSVCAPL